MEKKSFQASFWECSQNFKRELTSFYDNIVQLRKKTFQASFWECSQNFIRELTSWLEDFNRVSEHKSIALKVCIILPSLLLQKPPRDSKAKDHSKKLEERLSTWKGGKIMDFVKEGRIIQERVRSSCQRVSKDYSKIFANLMMQGRVSSALKILTSDPCVGAHEVNDDVINPLKQKHPKPSPLLENNLLNGLVNETLLVILTILMKK